jgi:hypothetical protein
MPTNSIQKHATALFEYLGRTWIAILNINEPTGQPLTEVKLDEQLVGIEYALLFCFLVAVCLVPFVQW